MNKLTVEDIPDHLVGQLRQLLKLRDGEDIPEDVVTEYHKLNGLMSRIGCNPSGHPLALMIYKMGYAAGISVNRPPKSVRQMWKDQEIGADHPVRIKWRNKWQDGVIKNVSSNGLIVQIDGDVDERVLKDELVKLPELVPA